MHIVPLHPASQQHTRIVLALVVQSLLDYGDIDMDPRLLVWINCQGCWAVAVADNKEVAGIVCTVHLNDSQRDALLWIEVLPHYQGQGFGKALLAWAQAQTAQPLLVRSVASAIGFYERAGVAVESREPKAESRKGER